MSQSKHTSYSQIATDLSDIDQVLKAMESQTKETSVEQGSIFIEPQTPLQKQLANIWANILGLGKIGIQDNFFDLGGNSLLATQVISQIRKVVQKELSLQTIFQYPTIKGFAKQLEDVHKTETAQQITPQKRTPGEAVALSFSQQRLWFLNQLEPDNPSYNMFGTVRLKGQLNVAAIEQSLNEIVQRHKSLQTTFITIQGEPVQVINSSLSFSLPVIDFESFPVAERETEARRVAMEESQRPFDLAHGPLMRGALLKLSETDHVFLLTMHHIISDGWSIGIFVKELTTLYQAFSAGQDSPLPELPIQYTDFAHWQREWLQGDVLDTQLTYWKEQLGGSLPVLELPTDRPRPSTQTFHGTRQSLVLPQSLNQALKLLSREENATLFMTLLTAFKVLLYRYTGQTDLIVGSPIAGRNQLETEDLIGFFVNNLTLRTQVSGDLTFIQLLEKVRKVALGAYAHQDVPFEKLVEVLQPERDLSHSPLFQVMFALQNMPMGTIELPGLQLSTFEVTRQSSIFDLTLFIMERNNTLEADLEYNTDLFDAATIHRLLSHFQTLLEGIVANPHQPIAELPLLPPAEQQQLLEEWNNTQMDYPQDQCLHQLFEAQVEKSPDATAVVFEKESLTYRELNERANQLAHHLQTLGVGADTLVGLHVDRSLEMVVGLLGILKAGGGYVPLDPAFPEERLAFMLADSQAPVLLTQNRLKDYISTQTETAVICLDSDWDLVAQHPTANLPNVARPDNLAYVIYTSGSTGKPKGVQLQHQGVVNFLTTMRQEPGLTAEDVLLSVTTLSFDISVLEIFLPLTTGAKVALVSRETAADGLALSTKLAETGATLMQATPTTWRMLIDSGWAGDDKLKVLCGGEALPRELANQLLERCASLWNMYGPTETTIWSTVYQVQPGEAGGVLPIGRPIGNTQCYILDSQMQPVPIGVPGELYLGGDGLARGYLNRKGLTAEKFIDDPFSDKPGARSYKTGDLVRYLPDGKIEFLSRIDHQIKIRGFRVELGEIEAVLGQHPAISEVVVVAREDTPGDKRLVGYPILNKNEAEPTVSELRNFARERLPDYMVPSTFVFLDVYPLTPNKKIDRKALPIPNQTRPELESLYVAPRDDVEEGLVNIMAEVLKVEQVGIHDNFFALGGHSLLATQVVLRLSETFQIELSLRSLFEATTVAELAQYIETMRLTTYNNLENVSNIVNREELEL